MGATLLSALNPTLQDVARVTQDKSIADVIEIIALDNEIMSDITYVEANNTTSHRTTMRTGYPTGTWRIFNKGVPQAKTTSQQVDANIGMLEDYSVIDKSLADLNGNAGAWKLQEQMGFIQGLGETVATNLFYGDESINKERITGIAPRYSATSTDKKLAGYNAISAGGSVNGQQTSIYLITWGPLTATCIYPKGSKAGLQVNPKPQAETVQDTEGNSFEAYRTHYKWDIGFCLRDWRSCGRIANIDMVAMATAGTTSDSSPNIINYLNLLISRVKNKSLGRSVLYCNSDLYAYLSNQLQSKSNIYFSMGDFMGAKVLMYKNIPIKLCDAILSTEDAIS